MRGTTEAVSDAFENWAKLPASPAYPQNLHGQLKTAWFAALDWQAEELRQLREELAMRTASHINTGSVMLACSETVAASYNSAQTSITNLRRTIAALESRTNELEAQIRFDTQDYNSLQSQLTTAQEQIALLDWLEKQSAIEIYTDYEGGGVSVFVWSGNINDRYRTKTGSGETAREALINAAMKETKP